MKKFIAIILMLEEINEIINFYEIILKGITRKYDFVHNIIKFDYL